MPNDAVRLKLRELLDANARFSLAARGTTNHCPMALVALAEMGASTARLQAFFDMWEREYALTAPRVETVISRDEWAQHVGESSAFGSLRLCFLGWIADVGYLPVMTAVFEEIPFAPASGAFHALIRLAYGIEAAHAGEIAAGLAALVSSHLYVDAPIDARDPAVSATAGFERVAKAMGEGVVAGNSITSRLRAVAADVRFKEALLVPPAASPLLDELARATINAYWRRPDFTVLHTVTGTHAARIVFAELPETLVNRLLPGFWVALCAAYASVGTGASVRTGADTRDVALDWREVCRMAVASDDDHVIKMTYTCLCEDRRSPSPLYLASATRLVSASLVESDSARR
ncbi:Protein of unknown function [Paraburkholderia phenazinium]|uniref:DUF4243 domain-containing protein n=1 Tax=Paraburkholderia phenazinium TaxID=60549 RepID=A0A1G8EHM7_9BURK|nr:questin oxidase family protein [Paraburkholderia phenazinium]SDH69398.1 Protein of unknown function [Paraburkholderia phenazinium]